MTNENAATLLTHRLVHDGPVFSVVSDRIHLPNGREATLDVVRHCRSVILLPTLDDTHIILVRQYRYAIDRWIWELPAGNIEPGEDPDDAARRECAEETGRMPSVVTRIGTFFPTPGYCDEEMLFYRLTGLTPASDAQLDADEVLEPHVIGLDDARRMVADGTITDMKTALGLSLIP